MSALDRLFPNKFCVNLQRRPDRWQKMLHQFELHDVRNVIRHDAIDSLSVKPPATWPHCAGAHGCLMSHIKIIREAHESGLPSVLILEDDVVFHDDFQARFEDCAEQVPDDWDAIFLGGLHLKDPAPVSPGMARLTDSVSTFAYGLRKSSYVAILREAETQTWPIDHWTRAMQSDFRFYCCIPHLAWVAEDYSDIINSGVNYWWLKDGIAMNGESIRKVLGQTTVFLRVPDADWCAQNPEIVQCVTYCYRVLNLRVQFLPGSQADAATIGGLLEPGDEYVVVADADVYPFVWEFKASLLKCQSFDRVLPILRAFPLNVEDTRLVIRTLIRDVDTLRYEPVEARYDRAGSGQPEFCIYSRAGLLRPADREPATFYSPSRLVRLHP